MPAKLGGGGGRGRGGRVVEAAAAGSTSAARQQRRHPVCEVGEVTAGGARASPSEEARDDVGEGAAGERVGVREALAALAEWVRLAHIVDTAVVRAVVDL